MSKKRSFNDFFATSGDEGVKTIALEYATYDDSVTIKKLAEQHNLTEEAVKKIFEHAIVNCLVPYRIAILMKEKSHRNQARHSEKKSERTPSDKRYDSLISKRIETIAGFPSERVKEIVDLYLESKNLSAKAVAYSVGLSKQELNLVIKNAIILDIVDNDTVNRLNQAALYRALSKKEQIIISEILSQYKKLRDFYASIISKIEMLEYQLKTLEDYAPDADFEKLRKEAEKELKKAEKARDEFKASLFRK